jgi:hypothetical protein
MKKTLIALGVVALVGLGGSALASTPYTGSSEDGRQPCPENQGDASGAAAEQCTYDGDGQLDPAGQDYAPNQVTCDNDNPTSLSVPVGTITVTGAWGGGAGGSTGSGTLEACDDSGAVQGRIIATGSDADGGGYIAADGDHDNPDEARGWARVDLSADPGVRCGGADGSMDSTDPGDGDTTENCMP